ncbi:hypothetical protein TWF481_004087 [Arthrobotrys musiformis]|uniref:Endonuclease/exonuclease/phosphatase domain-containing protein n=1 Tax=Arthrobotrys musiformis TaxID=47236 RepID=A0AAV9WIL7_9PEZI
MDPKWRNLVMMPQSYQSSRPLDVARHYISHTIATRQFRVFVVLLALVLITRTVSTLDIVHLHQAPAVPRTPSPDAGVAHVLGINHYNSEEKQWKQVQNTEETNAHTQPRSNFALITWNVDFVSSEPQDRISAAMSHLRSLLISGTDDPDTISPAVIVLQEVNHEMVKSLAENEWVRKNFYITDVVTDRGIWQKSHYGTVTLVDRRIKVKNVIRLHYDSNMDRDCLFVDIEAVSSRTSEVVTVRVGNTHLESLVPPKPWRLEQLKLAARFVLYDTNVYTGLIAGDMNPIDSYDLKIPEEAGLKDAYLVGGGEENNARGHTWGYQTEENRYPKRRFDKIFHPPGDKIKVEQVETIGVGEKTPEKPKVYISDHYGVFGNVRIL